MKKDKIVTALASFGMSGRIFHAPFIQHLEAYELNTILERSKNLSQDKYPNARIARSFDEICSNHKIDLIIINTPSHLHYSMTKQAIEAGKHVVVEKPFTSTSKEASELIELAKTKNVTLTIYHNKRLESSVKTIQKIIDLKSIGTVKEIKVQLRRYRPEPGPKKWKEDNFPAAGLLYDIGSHYIDQFLFLFGPPDRIESQLEIQRPNGKVNDFFDITFHYPGFKTRMISDLLTKESKYPCLEIVATQGSYKKYSHDPQEAQLASEDCDWKNLGVEDKKHYGTITKAGQETKFPSERGDYISFYENLSDVIMKRKKDLLVPPEEALAVINIIEKITH